MCKNLAWITFCAAVPALANGLSQGLSEKEVRQAASALSWSSVHRAWTAPAIHNPHLGLDLGLETATVFRRGLGQMGDRSAIVPRIVPLPRLWGAWDLPHGFQPSFSVAPLSFIDSISTYGAGLQFSALRNGSAPMNLSFVLHHTFMNAFGDIKSHTTGLSTQVSKDLTFWQPYAGFGFVVANARVRKDLILKGVDDGPYTLATFHAYAGFRLDFAALMSLQVDFVGNQQNVGLLMAQSF